MAISENALREHAGWLSGTGTQLVLRGEDAHGQDLRAAQLSGAVLEDCKLDGAQLGGTSWASARLVRCSLRDAVLGDANLDDASFVDCDFRDADLSVLASAQIAAGRGTSAGASFERCDLRGTIWLDRDLSGARFIDCQFDAMVGTPRTASGVELIRPRLANPDGTERPATADEILALWQVGKVGPVLGDDDKAFVHRGLQGRWRKREAYLARAPRPAPRTGVGSLADKWSEPFLPEVGGSAAAPASEPGEPVELPRGTAAGVVARRTASGVVVYRDPRSELTLALPSPVFLSPSPDMDATAGVGGAVLHVCRVALAPGVRESDEVLALVRDLTGAEPEPLELGAGVTAAAVGTARQRDAIREVAAIAGGQGERAAVVLLMLDYGPAELDAVAALTVWSAIVSSAAFGRPRHLPALVPASPWWQPGLPPRLAASRPPLPRIERGREAALDLVALTALLPPTQPIDDVVRSAVADRLARAGLADPAPITATLATIHDLRGLAVALTS